MTGQQDLTCGVKWYQVKFKSNERVREEVIMFYMLTFPMEVSLQQLKMKKAS